MNTVEPIRDKEKIEAMKKVLKADNYRNYLLFVLGINTGLRISDLLTLKVQDVISNKGRVRDSITIRERKTGKERKFMINKASQKAIEGFPSEFRNTPPETFLFASKKGDNAPISRIQAWQVLNNAARTVGIKDSIGTHTLRKTFGYHAYQQGTDITLLQKVFNHSAPSITLRYIGITQDDIDQVYINLNL